MVVAVRWDVGRREKGWVVVVFLKVRVVVVVVLVGGWVGVSFVRVDGEEEF